MNTEPISQIELPGINEPAEPARPPRLPRRQRREPKEWKLVTLRECPAPESMTRVQSPQDAVDYWKAHVTRAAHFNPDCECVVVLLLNTRKRIRGHTLISVGSLSEATAHPREIFRIAVMAAAHSLILMHNHPSGEPDPSDSDQRLTRQVKDAGRILGIPLCDHVIVGHQRYFSFLESGLL